MFVDSSVIVAILRREPDAEPFARAIRQGRGLMTSPLAIFESVTRLSNLIPGSVEDARVLVEDFLDLARISVEPVDADVGQLALAAFERYGKGRHPARLNFGDCFSYAMAKHHGVALLYKGDDFARTDLG